MAVLLCLQAFCKSDRNTHIQLLVDNVTAASYVREMGGTHSGPCDKTAHEVWVWAVSRHIWLSIAHVPGVRNVEADGESRRFHTETEWKPRPSVFRHVVAHFGFAVDIDLMVPRTNCQVPRFMSWRPDHIHGSSGIDAFAVDWRLLNFWCVPPFSLNPSQDQAGPSNRLPGGPLLANAALFSRVDATCGCAPEGPPTRPEATTLTRTAPLEPSTTRQAQAPGLQVVRLSLRNQGLSEQSTNIVLAAWRPATSKQQGSYLTKCTAHCREQQTDPFHPSVPQVLNFLTTRFNAGVGYNAINTAKSALATLVTLSGGQPLRKHPTVLRHMKGIFETRPSLPRYSSSCNVSTVLKHLKGLDLSTLINMEAVGAEGDCSAGFIVGPATSNLVGHGA